MSLATLGILLCAAIFHSRWNLLLKQAQNKQVFLMWATLSNLICFLALPFLPPIPAQIWPFVLFSALAETLYYISLAWAYNIGDFSLVYPIARGAAPVLLTVWAMLFLKEIPNVFGLLGIILIVIGLVTVGTGASWKTLSISKLSLPSIIVALFTATCISVYSTIDGAAVSLANPLSYTIWVCGLPALFAAPFIILRHGTRLAVIELKERWLHILTVGFLIIITYGAVLFAYSMGRISYVGSIREVSIVFGALMGWHFLGEKFGLVRVIGAELIFAGIAMIAILG